MYIRFLTKFKYHKVGDILNTTNAVGEYFLHKNIAVEMVEDYQNDNKLITRKEYEELENMIIEENYQEQLNFEQERKELDKILEDTNKEVIPKKKRGRPRKSPNNKMVNTKSLITK